MSRFSFEAEGWPYSAVLDSAALRVTCPDGAVVTGAAVTTTDAERGDTLLPDLDGLSDAAHEALAAALREHVATSDDVQVAVFGAYEIRDALRRRGGKYDGSSKSWLIRRGDLKAALAETGASLETGEQFRSSLAAWVRRP